MEIQKEMLETMKSYGPGLLQSCKTSGKDFSKIFKSPNNFQILHFLLENKLVPFRLSLEKNEYSDALNFSLALFQIVNKNSLKFLKVYEISILTFGALIQRESQKKLHQTEFNSAQFHGIICPMINNRDLRDDIGRLSFKMNTPLTTEFKETFFDCLSFQFDQRINSSHAIETNESDNSLINEVVVENKNVSTRIREEIELYLVRLDHQITSIPFVTIVRELDAYLIQLSRTATLWKQVFMRSFSQIVVWTRVVKFILYDWIGNRGIPIHEQLNAEAFIELASQLFFSANTQYKLPTTNFELLNDFRESVNDLMDPIPFVEVISNTFLSKERVEERKFFEWIDLINKY